MTRKVSKKSVRTAASKPGAADVSARAQVFLCGEAAMVLPFAEACAAAQYDVLIRLNEGFAPKFLSKLIKSSPTIPSGISVAVELTNLDREHKRSNLEKLGKALAPTAPILSTSITVTATEQSSWIEGNHRLVGIAGLPTLLERPVVEVAPTIYSPRETVAVVQKFFQSLTKEIELVQDRVGMVVPRIICQLINEAAFALQEEVASPQDIDTAMKLGANYPYGPIEWAERIGVRQVCAVLEALQQDLHEERYRTAPLLKQMAFTGR